MTDCVEIAITSDSSEQLWSSCVWDVRTGTHLMSYKGGGAPGAHTLAIIKNKFILSGNLVKPMLNIWPINSHEPISTRFILAGRPSSIAVSADGNFCVVCVQETIYVYQLATGLMLASISRHYQAINTTIFTDDGSHFITAGQDGMVLVWSLAQVVRLYQKQTLNPIYSFSDHALPVTDLYIGKGGMKSIVCSVSADRSCRIYDLASGNLLLNLVFQEALSSVTMDNTEANVFIGTCDGPIYIFNIQSSPRMKEFHVNKKQSLKNMFLGHKKSVTCVSVSIDGDTLMSGSVDENVIIWNIKSRQQLRTIPHKGAITNAFFMLTPKVMFDQETKLNPLFSTFQRMVFNNDNAEDQTIEVLVSNNVSTKKELVGSGGASLGISVQNESSQEELNRLRKEVMNLKAVNKELYEFSLGNIMKEQ